MSRGAPRDSHRLRVIKSPHRNQDELDAVEDPVVSPLVGEPPDWLPPLAVAEWHRVALDLRKKDWLGAIDETIFASYCLLYARWREAEDHVATEGLVVEEGDPDKGQFWKRPNPHARLAITYRSEMEKAAKLFGVTPGARKGWTQPKEQKSGIAKFRENLAT